MPEIDLMQPVTTNGIRNANYFNGRVLTAEDLSADQRARRQQLEQLGLAVGAGVVRGFNISAPSMASLPTTATTDVHVTKGLAINEDGNAVALGTDVDVALVKIDDQAGVADGLFAPCSPLLSTTLDNPGLYILTARPASSFAERAPMTELGGNGVSGSCGSRYGVEGAEFRLAVLDPGSATSPGLRGVVATLLGDIDTKIIQASSLSSIPQELKNQEIAVATMRLRNAVAYLCLGVESFADFSDSPFPRADGRVPAASYGALDLMRSRQQLASCEVPLALIYWSRRGVEFVDQWAVRRSVHPTPVSTPWSPVDRRRRTVEGLAMLLQFQAQLEDIRASNRADSDLAALKASDLFAILPPCGFVPISGGGARRSFTIAQFFSGLMASPFTVIASEKVEAMVQEALSHPPLTLGAKGMVQVYVVDRPTDASRGQPYALFVTRAVHGPLEDDGIAQVFPSAWDAYRGFVRNRTFLPMDNSSNSEAARITILGAIQDVMAVATREGVLAAGRSLAYDDALAAFQAMYDVQDELCTLLTTGLPGVGDLNNRAEFAAALRKALDGGGASGTTALKPALAAANLRAVLTAQEAINALVAGWSGDGIAMGDIIVNYTGDSPEGTTFVPGSATVFRHRFQLLNKTDKPLTIRVSALVTATGGGAGDWTGNLPGGNAHGGAVEVQLPEGTAIPANGVRVDRSGTRAFTVAVKTPDNAVIGALAATMTINAVTGPPNNKTFSLPQKFDVAAAQTPPSTRNISMVVNSGDVTDHTVTPSITIEYAFTAIYNAKDGAPANFKFKVSVASKAGGITGWGTTIHDVIGVITPGDPYTAESPEMPIAVGASGLLFNFAVFTAPAAQADRSATVTVHIESTDAEHIKADDKSWTLTVPHS
jgi:hypothetical protein